MDRIPDRGHLLGALFVVAVLAGTLATAGMDGRAEQDGDRPNIVLIGVDRMRAGNLPCYGYQRNTTPNICGLAEDGTLFTEAYAQATWTLPSVATLLTSEYPVSHGVLDLDDRLPDNATTLAEVLSRRGYRTAAFPGNNGKPLPGMLHPELNMGQGFETYGTYSMFLRDNVPAALNWLDSIRAGRQHRGTPFFMYVQGYEPHRYAHRKYYVNESQQRPVEERMIDRFAGNYTGPLTDASVLERYGNPVPSLHWNASAGYYLDATGEPVLPLSDRDARHIRNYYDAELAYADHSVGRLLDGLKQRGLYEDSIIIIHSSHGEVWRPESIVDESGQRVFFHGLASDSVLRIPLIIRQPDSMPSLDGSETVGLVDLMPSLLSWADVPVDAATRDGMQGDVLRAGQPGSTTEYAFSELDQQWIIWHDDWKLIRDPGGSREGSILYDTSVPVGEREDVSDRHPDVTRDLIQRLETHRLRVLGSSGD